MIRWAKAICRFDKFSKERQTTFVSYLDSWYIYLKYWVLKREKKSGDVHTQNQLKSRNDETFTQTSYFILQPTLADLSIWLVLIKLFQNNHTTNQTLECKTSSFLKAHNQLTAADPSIRSKFKYEEKTWKTKIIWLWDFVREFRFDYYVTNRFS